MTYSSEHFVRGVAILIGAFLFYGYALLWDHVRLDATFRGWLGVEPETFMDDLYIMVILTAALIYAVTAVITFAKGVSFK